MSRHFFPYPRFVLLLGLVLSLYSLFAGAATFTVTNLNDSGPGSLRQAVLDANAAAGADTIVFLTGLNGTLRLLSGRITITDSLTISGPGAGILEISGNNALQIFYINGSGKTFSIDGLTLKEGGNTSYGGAIQMDSGTLTLSNSTLSRNSARYGGGIHNRGTLIIRNSLLTGNTVTGGAYEGVGGGIQNRGTLTVIDSTLTGSTAIRGGGIYNDYGTLTVIDSTLSGNTASRWGGGIYSNRGTLTVIDSTLSGNTASTRNGGGIYASGDRVTVTNSTLSGNTAIWGGGIYNYRIPLTVINSTLSGNTAQENGGGIYGDGGTTTAINSTVSGNSAEIYGGGVFCTGILRIGNSIMAGNVTLAPGSDVFMSGDSTTFDSQGHNLFSVNGLIGAAPTANDLILTGSITTAIGPLADNGGPTKTHLPIPGSPVIDAGDNALIPADITTDQRGPGFPRIVGGTVDIGAVEVSDCGHLILANHTVTGPETHQSCRITAGPNFTVTASGDATFRAGQRITLRPGFAVRAGGRFRAQIHPGLAAAAAAPPARHAAPTAAAASIAPPWLPATALAWSDLPKGLQARLRAHEATIRDAQRSADGAVIVFATAAALVAEDDNAHSDVYAYATDTDTLWLLSATPRGAAGAGPSHSPRLDGEGRHVIYLSTAPDLVAGPSNAYPQLYHHDLDFGSTARLTRTAAGRPGAGASDQPLLAGAWAIYRTAAPDLAPAGPGLYRQHLPDGRREAVGLDDGGIPDPRASHPAADAAGDQIAYQRPDPDERRQIYLTALPWVERLSLTDDPALGPLDHCCAALGADGRYLAYREQGAAGPAWLHLRDRARDRYVRLPWPTDEALAEQAPVFRDADRELWWLAPEQGPELPEVRHRLANPLRETNAR